MDNNQSNLEIRRTSRSHLKKAVNEAKEAWLLKKVKRVNNMNCDPYNAWQCVKEINKGLTGHHQHLNNDLLKIQKADGTIASTEAESAKEIANYFSTNVFSRESPFDRKAVEELTQKPINTLLEAPLRVKEARECLNKAQSRKAPGSNGIPIELYKMLDESNLPFIVAAMQA